MPTASGSSCLYKAPSHPHSLPPPDRKLQQPPLAIRRDFGGPDFPKYKGGGFDLHFLEGDWLKRLVYVPIVSFSSFLLNWSHILDLGFHTMREKRPSV